MRKFEFYEFAGIVAPGAMLLLGIGFVYPSIRESLSVSDAGFGGLGIFVILAFVIGHLVQALGNVIDGLWWYLWKGKPTDWIRTGHHQLISRQQLDNLNGRLGQLLGLHNLGDISTLTKEEWLPLTKQTYALVSSAGRSARIDIFNGNYGLFRGIAASLIVILLLTLVEFGLAQWKWELVLLVTIAVAVYRMHRFAKHYARELFIQCLQAASNEAGRES